MATTAAATAETTARRTWIAAGGMVKSSLVMVYFSYTKELLLNVLRIPRAKPVALTQHNSEGRFWVSVCTLRRRKENAGEEVRVLPSSRDGNAELTVLAGDDVYKNDLGRCGGCICYLR